MEFKYEYKDLTFKNSLKYIEREYSLFFESTEFSDTDILLGNSYVNLDGSSLSNQIIGISGFSPINSWINKNLNIPDSKTGKIYYKNDIMPGTSIQYGDKFPVYFDKEKSWICIGNLSFSEDNNKIKFANNIIAVFEKSDIISIWAKLEII